MVEAIRSWRGHHVRRFTFGEEYDATGHEALTLLDSKARARMKVNSSC